MTSIKTINNLFYSKARKLYRLIILIKYFLYDSIRFIKYSGALNGDFYDEETLISAITMDYHRLEKGLALENTRFKFGMDYIPKLVDNIIFYRKNYGDHEAIEAALNALKTYLIFHESNSISLNELGAYQKKINHLLTSKKDYESSVLYCSREEIVSEISKLNFFDFVNSRHSIRSFTSDLINQEVIESATKIAVNTPSVCNRQPWRIYSITGKKVQEALKYQNGNRGFSSQINNLIIIVGKLSSMRNTIERRQIYIDGGLFSMTLIYAFHSLGIGSCPLNWCVDTSKDKKVRTLIPIQKDEEIIMYLAIGNLKKEFKITKSPRLNKSFILKNIE